MKIGFDAKRLYNNFTGLGNYSRFIVEALSTFCPENKYVLFTPAVKANPDTRFFIESANVQTVLPPTWVTRVKLAGFWRSVMISATASQHDIEVYHGLSHELPYGISKRMKTVVTVHDLIFYRYPQFYKPADVLIYKAKLSHACRTADIVIAISEQTRQDVIEFLKIDPQKVRVIYQGCHANFRRAIDQAELHRVREKYKLPNTFVLNVGTIEPRKNVLHVLKAMHALNGTVQFPLLIIGRPTNYINTLKAYIARHNLEKRVLFIHTVDFVDLPAIYRLASVFVYPSLFEGFGIPLVEAIACQVPVITSTGSCFVEAAGADSIYVDPHDDMALASQLRKLLSDEADRARRVKESTRFIKKFEPQVIARDLMSLYTDLL